MSISKLMKKPLPEVPSNIEVALKENRTTGTTYENMNDVLINDSLYYETGYKKQDDGSYVVSMYCPMPGITPEMIEWWFWWHPKKDERYQVWFPGSHFKNRYSRKQATYFESNQRPAFQNNTQYPTEKIGGIRMPLRIDFVTPEEFGFSKEIMLKNNIPLIVCGHVGAFGGLIWHTEMAHIFKRTEEGLFMISRFWLGKTMKNSLFKKLIVTDDTARGMAEHCCIEYRNLHEILPELYKEFGNSQM